MGKEKAMIRQNAFVQTLVYGNCEDEWDLLEKLPAVDSVFKKANTSQSMVGSLQQAVLVRLR